MGSSVRKHRAPNGALRHLIKDLKASSPGGSESAERQTVHQDMTGREIMRKSRIGGQKAPSAKRRIKTGNCRRRDVGQCGPESTERQKVH